MKWYQTSISPDSIVISSRVRLARNLENYPFPQKLDNSGREKVISEVKNALTKFSDEKFIYSELSERTPGENAVLAEDHLISREFCDLPHSTKRTLITNESGNVAVMVCEEDHLRIQSILPGLAIEKAYENADAMDDIISEGVTYAYDEKLGYLTSCPTNFGTGLRASVMLHLPAIKEAGYLKSVISLMTKIGLTVRGLYGEGSESQGCLYQISNQITLGISEKDTIEKLTNAVAKIVDKETELRAQLATSSKEAFEDRIWRAYGTLTNARLMSFSEFVSLWSDIKLGVVTGVLDDRDIRSKNLTSLLISAMPSHICEAHPDAKDPSKRDLYRAKMLREFFTIPDKT